MAMSHSHVNLSKGILGSSKQPVVGLDPLTSRVGAVNRRSSPATADAIREQTPIVMGELGNSGENIRKPTMIQYAMGT